jgi:hypothetical protein
MTAPGPGNVVRHRSDVTWDIIVTRDGVPIKYECWGSPRSHQVPELVERIRALTGYTVTFGEWVFFDSGPPYDHTSEVPLTVVPNG